MLAAMRLRPSVVITPSTPPVTGYQVWYDASDTATITESGGAVSQWDDKSGNSYHLTQGTEANKPTTGGTRNGRNVLSFDGTNDRLAISSIGTVGLPSTLFVVASRGGDTSQRQLIESWDTAHRFRVWTQGPSSMSYGAGTDVSTTASWSLSTWHQVSCLFKGGVGAECWMDGSSVNTTSTMSGTMVGLSVGCYNPGGSASNFWDGGVAEVILYTSELSTADRQSVEAYLKAKWGTP